MKQKNVNQICSITNSIPLLVLTYQIHSSFKIPLIRFLCLIGSMDKISWISFFIVFSALLKKIIVSDKNSYFRFSCCAHTK
jgi:hypothetical protein